MTPVTVIVWPETVSAPTLAVEKPGPATVDGGVQPDGTTTVTEPVSIPPVAGVYVSVTTRPVWPAETTEIEATSVPEPSAAYTVIDGDAARFARTPPSVDCSCAWNVCAPVVEPAVAPGPPPPVSP